MIVEPALHSFEDMLVLPSGDPTPVVQLIAQLCQACVITSFFHTYACTA
jgi:hypothetical protein